MNDQEAKAQISQMEAFILKEAKDKSEEIESKGQEEFNIEKFRIVTAQKEKIRSEYAKKAKQVETQCAIARSLAINKSRLEKIKARQEVLGKIAEDAKLQLKSKGADAGFVTKLIVQGALMLLEDKITVQCRQSDAGMVQGCFGSAASQYSQVIKKETGADRAVSFELSREFVSADKLGGVVLSCMGGDIKIDNTVDLRLQLALEQDKPAIRSLLFPVTAGRR
jgi:V-type H+-transporting ATPase subunit E